VQVTAACLTPDDVIKVNDQGADDTTNAVSIRKFFVATAGVAVTEATDQATIIQTRHRIPEQMLTSWQILLLLHNPPFTCVATFFLQQRCTSLRFVMSSALRHAGNVCNCHPALLTLWTQSTSALNAITNSLSDWRQMRTRTLSMKTLSFILGLHMLCYSHCSTKAYHQTLLPGAFSDI
jgi:hypothetical protein